MIEDYTLHAQRGLLTPQSQGWRAWFTVEDQTFYAEARTERQAVRAARRKAKKWERYGPQVQS